MTKTETGGAFPAWQPIAMSEIDLPLPLRITDTVKETGHIKISGAGNYGLVCTVGHGDGRTKHKFESLAALIITAVNAYEPNQARIEALEAEVARLEDQLDEARHAPWPQWADDIRKKLEEYGVDAGPENEWDIGEQFEIWVEGVVEDAIRQHRAALESRHD